MSDQNEYDPIVIVVAFFVFCLPLTLLIPEFSIWDIIPKIRVTRFHAITQVVTWAQMNTAIIVLLLTFFTLYLETRKRRLDDIVEKVLMVNKSTEVAANEEFKKQTSAMKASVGLLEASADHYERLMLLRDEVRRRELMKRQHPPTVELTSSEM